MRYIALILIFASIPAWSYDDIIARKRYEAEARKMQVMQQIQHRKSNPDAFLLKPSNISEDDSSGEQSVSFNSGSNGHFYIPATMNGRSVNFIADTGASDIFLTQDDARKIGLSTYNLNYNLTYNTANGQVKAAQTNVANLAVGPIKLSNVTVSVSQNNGGASLLGMTFFSRLSRYEVRDGVLTLYK